jgi:5-methylcytosine-specific restriction endonuclease McrA
MPQKARRNNLFRKQRGICFWCGIKCLPVTKGGEQFSDTFTVDHIVPRSRGGADDTINTVGCCFACNGRRNEIQIKLESVKRFYEYFKRQPLKYFPVDSPNEVR